MKNNTFFKSARFIDKGTQRFACIAIRYAIFKDTCRSYSDEELFFASLFEIGRFSEGMWNIFDQRFVDENLPLNDLRNFRVLALLLAGEVYNDNVVDIARSSGKAKKSKKIVD